MTSPSVASAPAETKSPSPLRSIPGAIAVTALDAALLALALGGITALLHHARALALLAAWTIGGIALAMLRPVRKHDPEEVRAEAPITLLSLFVIPLVIPPISAFGEHLGLWILPGGGALRWSGVALSALGLAIRIIAMTRLGSRFSPLVAVQKGHALESGGIYSRIRHPGYLGSWLTSLGASLAFGSALALPLVAIMLFLLDRRMRREEEVLERHFGDEYRSYRERSGRMLPRF